MTFPEYRIWLRNTVDKRFNGNQSKASKAWGVDPAHLSNVLNGKKQPFPQLAKGTGHVICKQVLRALPE